jgi:AraC-like DNA-binding protein
LPINKDKSHIYLHFIDFHFSRRCAIIYNQKGGIILQIRICGNGVFTNDEPNPGGMHPSHISEILYILDGEVRIHWSGNHCKVKAPAVLLIGPDTPHHLENLGQPVRYCFMELVDADKTFFNVRDVDLWNLTEASSCKLPNEDNLEHREMLSVGSFTSTIHTALEFVHSMHITRAIEEHPDIRQICELEVRKVLLLIHHILDLKRERVGNDKIPKKWSLEDAVNSTIAYLDWRYKDDITLQTLADRVRFNPSYLIRVFRKYVNMTPFQYLQELRLKAASNYLAGSEMPIRQIAEETGFNSIHYFSRQFKEKFGDSPASWRKKRKSDVV